MGRLHYHPKEFPIFKPALLLSQYLNCYCSSCCQLQELKVEPVLLHYLSYIKVLQGTVRSTHRHTHIHFDFRSLTKITTGLEIRVATSTRLKTCLYNFTSPGGPMYPTRDVRHAAWDALDFLFPCMALYSHMISTVHVFLLLIAVLKIACFLQDFKYLNILSPF